ncbi:MAG: hypothetical protein HC933_21305 [Pleurocapsa sp. SU_196_0]|nr:hypothetical protein [Pleurocapsa sp. SU_196_0]
MDLRALLFQIKRMQELNLLCLTRTESRRGSPVKYYRATSDCFFVPFTATALDSLEAMVDAWSQSLQPVFLRSFTAALERAGEGWGVRIARNADGPLEIRPARSVHEPYDPFEPDAPVIIEGWYTDLWLNEADAKSLQYELAMSLTPVTSSDARQRYIIACARAAGRQHRTAARVVTWLFQFQQRLQGLEAWEVVVLRG